MTALGPGLLRFEETYFERIWGGRNLERLYGKGLPPETPVGEAWLISDHPAAESVIKEGPFGGWTLHRLLERHAPAVLGSRARLTIHGRFPLLLKLLDSHEWLSVQVHPDDACAQGLGEPDAGKTEMWHVLHAEPGSELICGIDPSITASLFGGAVRRHAAEPLLRRFNVRTGDSVFVAAGTVHALGRGIVLAEIQQNSDLTYRIHDWDRVDARGRARDLHVDKALQAIRFGVTPRGPVAPLAIPRQGGSGSARRRILAACRYFAAERVDLPVHGSYTRETRGESFHILLGVAGALQVRSGSDERVLRAGEALLVPGEIAHFNVEGIGSFLDYYVPDMARDVVGPLLEAGHTRDAIMALIDGEHP